MAKIIFNVLFGVIKSVVNIILTPINLLMANLFPSFTTLINIFNSSIALYMGNSLAWFFSLLPPNTRFLVLLYLTILTTYYTIIFSYHLILLIIKIIKRVKIW